MTALITLTDNADRILAGRTESKDAKQKAVTALMAIEWATDLATAVGSKRANRLLRASRNERFPTDEYELWRDMMIYSTGESAPIQHTQWVVWRKLIARFRLCEIADIKALMRLVARFDKRCIRAPGCLARIPFDQLMAAEWKIPHPDMLVWILQVAMQDAGEFPPGHYRARI